MMKSSCNIVCLLLSFNYLFAHNKFDTSADTTKRFYPTVPASFGSENTPLIVVDGVITSKQELYKVDPNTVDNIEVLKATAATPLFGSKASNGAMLIFTKFAKSKYQQTLSDFSEDYRSFIKNSNFDDTNINYVVNGKQLDKGTISTTFTLLLLKKNDIKDVVFKVAETNGRSSNAKYTVYITK